VLLVAVGAVLVLDPSLLVHQVHLGTAPSWSQLIFALSVAMVAYTGIETVSNMAEEARDPARDVPKAVNLVLVAVLAVYAGISVVALSALPVTVDAHGHYMTALGTTYEADRTHRLIVLLYASGNPFSPVNLVKDLVPATGADVSGQHESVDGNACLECHTSFRAISGGTGQFGSGEFHNGVRFLRFRQKHLYFHRQEYVVNVL